MLSAFQSFFNQKISISGSVSRIPSVLRHYFFYWKRSLALKFYCWFPNDPIRPFFGILYILTTHTIINCSICSSVFVHNFLVILMKAKSRLTDQLSHLPILFLLITNAFYFQYYCDFFFARFDSALFLCVIVPSHEY